MTSPTGACQEQSSDPTPACSSAYIHVGQGKCVFIRTCSDFLDVTMRLPSPFFNCPRLLVWSMGITFRSRAASNIVRMPSQNLILRTLLALRSLAIYLVSDTLYSSQFGCAFSSVEQATGLMAEVIECFIPSGHVATHKTLL